MYSLQVEPVPALFVVSFLAVDPTWKWVGILVAHLGRTCCLRLAWSPSHTRSDMRLGRWGCPFSQRFMFSAVHQHLLRANYISIKFQISWHFFFFFCSITKQSHWPELMIHYPNIIHTHLNKGISLDSKSCLIYNNAIRINRRNEVWDVSPICLRSLRLIWCISVIATSFRDSQRTWN